MEMMENTPQEKWGNPLYAADKKTRDAAWDTLRALSRAALPPEMEQLIAEGYANKLSTGDQKGASLFARATANRMNTGAIGSKPGWLKKGGGSNVDGYAEDALVLNANPSDLMNVMDCVQGTGAPGAQPSWNGPLPRRSSDTWEAPKPLTSAELAYLGVGGPIVVPPEPAYVLPGYEALGGDAIFRNLIGKPLQADMRTAQGLPMDSPTLVLDDGSAVWFSRTVDRAYREMITKTLTGAAAQQAIVTSAQQSRAEWRAILGLP